MKNKILLLAFLLIISGCTYRHDATIFLSPELKDYYGYYPSLEVDIAGINDNEKSWISSYKLNKYFQPDNPMRKTLQPYTMVFSNDDDKHYQKFSHSAKEWDLWKRKGAKELFIAVNLPGIEDDNARKILMEIRSYIGKRLPLFIEIKPTGISLIDKKPEYIKE